uniref:BRCT domain-containing protein n=1 Tax=Strongyloides papillosus TaxID=174720 RepID=A0A0N5C707_STREA
MSNNDSTAVVPQENGPNGSTAENVPPMQEIQENTKEDCTGDLKEIVDSKPTSTEVVTVEATTNDMEKGDKSGNVNNHASPIKEDTNTEVKDVPSKEDHNSTEKTEEDKPEEPVLKVDKEEESTKVDEENEVSIVDETIIEEKDTTVNNITEVAQTTTEEAMECSTKEGDKSEKEDTKSDKEDVKSDKEEIKSEKEETKSEKEEDIKTDTSQPIEEKPSQETASLLDNTSNLSIDDEKKETESTPRSRPRRNIPTSESVTKEEPTTGKRGSRRSKVVRETNNDEEESNTVEQQQTPSTGRRGRKTAKIQEKVNENKVHEEENVDVEPMEVDEDVETKTPKRGAKKASQKSTPAVTEKKRGTKRKNNDEVSKDNKKVKPDDDAYNIDNLDEHPEISESFKLERQSNGGAKFLATSSYKRGRFSVIEKAAKERNADTLNGDSEDAVEPSEKKSISLLTLSDKKLVSQIDDEKSADKKGLNTPVSRPNNKVPKSTSKTPKSVVKNSVKKPAAKATPAPVKNTDSSDFMVPELSEDSQFEADTKFESGEVNPYARVYAYFSGVCYAAISTGKSTVSSFEVQFIDDKVMKYIARGGLYRLQELAIGLDVEFMDGDDTFEGTIKKVPDSTKVSDFCKANFTIEKKDDDGKKKDVVVSWDKIILDKSVLKNVRNVETEIKTMGKTPKRKNQL